MSRKYRTAELPGSATTHGGLEDLGDPRILQGVELLEGLLYEMAHGRTVVEETSYNIGAEVSRVMASFVKLDYLPQGIPEARVEYAIRRSVERVRELAKADPARAFELAERAMLAFAELAKELQS